jgi:hypothetical protein
MKEKKEDLIELYYDDLGHFKRGIKAYVCNTLYFDEFENNIKDEIEKRIKMLITKHKIIKYEKTHYPNKVKVSTLNLQEIYNCVTLNGEIPKDNDHQIKLTHQSKFLFSIITNFKSKKLIICWNHGVLDGIRVRNYTLDFLNNNNSENKLNLIQYSQLGFYYGLANLIWNIRSLNRNHKPFFVNNCEKTKIYSFQITKKYLNNIQKQYNCSKNSAIQQIICNIIIQYKKGVIRNATIFGSKKINGYHNSHATITYSLDLNKKNNLDQIIRENVYQIHLMLNKYFLSKFQNNRHIDILFSGIPFSKNDLYINNYKVIDHSIYIPNHNVPVHFFSAKIGFNYFCNLGVRDKNFQHFLNNYDLTNFT